MVKVRRVASLIRNSLFGCLLALLSACGGILQHEYRSVGGEWSSRDTLLFANNRQGDSLSTSLDIYVGVRYNANYPYRKLWLEVENYACDTLIQRDTLCCDIYDSDGRMNGTIVGTLYQNEYYLSTTDIPYSKIHNIRIRHIMADSLLPGIYDVGIKLASPCPNRYEER